MQDFHQIRQGLAAPFDARDVDWRVSVSREQSGLAVPYIDSRAIQNRLDDVLGPFFWRTRFIPWHQHTPKQGAQAPVPSQLCGLSVYCEERGEWIEKMDGAENTDIESIKGGISDSFKRAAVLWGVGRYLYALGSKWVPVDDKKRITDAGRKQLSDHYADRLQKLGLAVAAAPASVDNAAAPVYRIGSVAPAPTLDKSPAFWVQLISPDGRQTTAFYRGTKQGLVGGRSVTSVRLVQQSAAGGSFYEMQDFNFAA